MTKGSYAEAQSPAQTKAQLEQAITALETQRAVLGDAVVEASVQALRQQLAALASPTPAPELHGERKLVTVMFADISGFTALSETLDPEAVRDLMNACFEALVPVVEKYGGTVDKFIGDEIMALFGAPTAHEDDPVRALRAALDMMDRLEQFNAEVEPTSDVAPVLNLGLHFGINTGRVIAGDLGTHDRREYSVMGDAVNLAARLEDASERGEILVGPDTYRLTAPLFEFETLEPMAFKGKADLVPVYRLRKAKPMRGKVRGIAGLSSPLVGREAEFQTLQATVADLQQGQGSVITLVGEAGLGKSRLVAELRHHVTHHASRFTLHEGRCLSYGGSIAYLLWLDLLRDFLGVSAEDDPLAVRAALRERVHTLCPDDFAEIYPYLATLLALPLEAEHALPPDIPGQSLRGETFYAVVTLLEHAAQAHPLVLICEDLHWADPTSLALLERVLPLTARVPLLLLCIMRPEQAHACWQLRQKASTQPHYRDVWIQPLSSEDSAALMENLLRIEALPPALRVRILAHAEGNPFYVEEIIRALMDDGAIVYDTDSEQWRATREVDAIAIPDTLHGVLMARIDRLEAETKRVLQLASVIGRTFFYRVLAALARAEQELDPHLRTLEDETLIRERAREPELEYIFKHQLTQEAAYNGLLKQERRAYHQQVAEALEHLFPDRSTEQAGLLAHHWEHAEVPEQAIPYLLQAGEQARANYANEEAIGYFQQALTLLDAGVFKHSQHKKWHLTAFREISIAHYTTGQLTKAETFLHEAIALGKEIDITAPELVRLYHWLGNVWGWQNQYDAMVHIGEEGLALLKSDTESLGVALMNYILSIGYLGKDISNWAQAVELKRYTAQFIEQLPYTEELRPVYMDISWLYGVVDKNTDLALQNSRTFKKKAIDHHDLIGLEGADLEIAMIFTGVGNYKEAMKHLQQSLEICTRIKDIKHTMVVLRNTGVIFRQLGNLQTSEYYMQKLLNIATKYKFTLSISHAHVMIGILRLCQSKWEQAVSIFNEALSIRRELGAKIYMAWALYHIGQAFWLGGKHNEARARFQEVISIEGLDLLQHWDSLPALFNGLEKTSEDPAAFRTYCQQFQMKHPEAKKSSLVQWWLEPTTVAEYLDATSQDDLTTLASAGTWHDPFEDCAYTVDNHGVEIRAANARDLWRVNRSAPRLLRPIAGDLVVQTACAPALADRPYMGGLLLWQNEQNYLNLEIGTFGERDIILRGCLDNEDVIIGRGLLPSEPASQRINEEMEEQVLLRLERAGEQVNAYCSGDDEQWYTVGHTTFPAAGEVQVGVHAIGYIDRSIYHGAYPDGTAIRFTDFALWQEDKTDETL
jgi:predicted ATPase/class 3 adenylate cyclase/regulation of enolase protein 1 (concanavalin A-like superfamily)